MLEQWQKQITQNLGSAADRKNHFGANSVGQKNEIEGRKIMQESQRQPKTETAKKSLACVVVRPRVQKRGHVDVARTCKTQTWSAHSHAHAKKGLAKSGTRGEG